MEDSTNESARRAVEQGNHKAAVAALRFQKKRSEEDELLLAECLSVVGPLDEALLIAAKFENSENLRKKARAARVRAQVASMRRPIGEAINLYERAVALATAADSGELSCEVRLDYFRGLISAGLGFPSVDSYEQLKVDVLRLGRPPLLAAFHTFACTFEAARGNLSLASAHASLAKAHLRTAPNPGREATLLLAQTVIASVETDIQPAIDLAERASRKAQESGSLWNQFAALASIGYLHLRAGRFKEAEVVLTRAEKYSTGSPIAEAAALETRAQVALAERRLDRCAELLQVVNEHFERDVAFAHSWYRVSTFQTEIRLAAVKGQWRRAGELCEAALSVARERNDRLFESLFSCYLAESILMQGDLAKSALLLRDGLLRFRSAPPALRVNFDRIMAVYLSARGRENDARAALTRAFETARGMCDVVACSEVQETATRVGIDIQGSDSIKTSLSDSSALDCVDQPQVFGERLFRALKYGCAFTALALYRTAAFSTEVAASSGISPDNVRDIIKRPREGYETVPLGESASRTYGLLVSTPSSVEDARELMTVRRLAAAAIALQKARDEAKSRESIWSDREIAVASGGIYLAPAMLELLDAARHIAPLNVPVLLTGETGVGKEVVARTIHESSARAAKPFIPFNCSAVPRDMVESQLFGYRRGAFTGAHENFSGVIRAASFGTVFLDEIGDLPLDIQPKLLRFLETAEVHPLGEPEPVKVEVRVIAATNVDLESLVAQGRFRTDLYYRLNVIPITVPPLRDRREEIPALANLYLRRYADEFDRGILTFTPETLEMLVTYKWPGNVRQLANEIRRVAALARADCAITPSMLSRDIVKTTADALPTRPVVATEPAKLPISLDQALAEAVASLEAAMIRRALAKAGGKVDDAAQMLGVSRKGLFLKRKRLGISVPES